MTTLMDTARVDVLPGDGTVIRLPGLVAVVDPGGSAAARSELVRSLQLASGALGTSTDSVALQLTRFILGHHRVPAFGVATTTQDGVAVFLYGDAHYSELGEPAAHTLRLSGRSAAFAVDRLLPPPHLPFGLGVGDCLATGHRGGPPDAPFGLVRGAVPGSGIIVGASDPDVAGEPTDGPAAAAPPAAPAPEPEIPAPAPPTPAASAPAGGAPAGEAPGQVLVEGISCSRGHLNSPDVAFCRLCGIRMSQRTADPVRGPRPPLGVLVFDDGSTHILDGDRIVGRRPPAATSPAHLQPLQLDDESGTLSRSHALITLDGWTTVLTDQGSANGTFVSTADDAPWMRIAAHEPFVMAPGLRVRVGRREFAFESGHARL